MICRFGICLADIMQELKYLLLIPCAPQRGISCHRRSEQRCQRDDKGTYFAQGSCTEKRPKCHRQNKYHLRGTPSETERVSIRGEYFRIKCRIERHRITNLHQRPSDSSEKIDFRGIVHEIVIEVLDNPSRSSSKIVPLWMVRTSIESLHPCISKYCHRSMHHLSQMHKNWQVA